MASMNEDNNVNEEDARVKEKDPLIQTYNKTNDGSGDYIDLVTPHRDSIPETTVPAPPPQPPPLLYWVKIGVLVLCFSVLGLVVFNWVGPFFIQKVFIPLINWQEETFTTKQLALIVFASISIFPTILLPSSPSMWFAGVIFGYLYGFLIVMSAAVIGVSLPFLIGSMFHHKIEGWLNKYPKKATVLRSAGGGNWFHQFRAVALIRISPFPYILYNYCSVATNVQYGPYLCGSLAGMTPEVIASIYTGILIRALADVSHKTIFLSAPQIAFNVVGFCIAIGTTVFFTLYAKRQLDLLRREDELLLKKHHYGSLYIN
ncbi:unnamed protein product [Vicia faba]|uniref:VTT domain-containing protein n=1 Tax=Vicia faba TaxID=3906 RepID=A0AAV0YW85_VICFA|nr:unnamed protein product [Vicia faba]